MPVGVNVELEPVAFRDKPVLGNLWQLYAHDFSEVMPLAIGADGRFGGIEDEWWQGARGEPFFIRRDGQLAGFALAGRGSVTTGDPAVMDVAEFFVLRGERQRGVGTRAAHRLFAAFRGPWEVRVRETNAGAMRFWPRAIEAFLGEACVGGSWEAKAVRWRVFRFMRTVP
jgi:predicted acetyltransferase